jgi:hypothetical protein
MPPVKPASGNRTRYPSCDAKTDAKRIEKQPGNIDAYASAMKGEGFGVCQYPQRNKGDRTAYGLFRESSSGGPRSQPGSTGTKTPSQPKPGPKSPAPRAPMGGRSRVTAQDDELPGWVPWVAGGTGLAGLLAAGGYVIKRVRDARRAAVQDPAAKALNERFEQARQAIQRYQTSPARHGKSLNWNDVQFFVEESDRRGLPVDQSVRDMLAAWKGGGTSPDSQPAPTSAPKPAAPDTVPDSAPKPSAPKTVPDSTPPERMFPPSVIDPTASGDDKTEPGVALFDSQRKPPSSDGKAAAEKAAGEKAAAEATRAEVVQHNIDFLESAAFKKAVRQESHGGNAGTDRIAVNVIVDEATGKLLSCSNRGDANATIRMTGGNLITNVYLRTTALEAHAETLKAFAQEHNAFTHGANLMQLKANIVLMPATAPMFERMIEANEKAMADGVEVVFAPNFERRQDTVIDTTPPSVEPEVATPVRGGKTLSDTRAPDTEAPSAPHTEDDLPEFVDSEPETARPRDGTIPVPPPSDKESAIATRATATLHSETEEPSSSDSDRPRRPSDGVPRVVVMSEDSTVGPLPQPALAKPKAVPTTDMGMPSADVTLQSVREVEPMPVTVAMDPTIPAPAPDAEEPMTVRATPMPPAGTRLAENVGDAFGLLMGVMRVRPRVDVSEIEHPDRLLYAMQIMEELKEVPEFTRLSEEARIVIATNVAVRVSEAFQSHSTPDMTNIVNEVAKYSTVPDEAIAKIATIQPSESLVGRERIVLGRIRSVQEEMASIPGYGSEKSVLLSGAVRDYLVWQGENGAAAAGQSKRGSKSMWLPPVEWLVERARTSAPRPAQPFPNVIVTPPKPSELPASPLAPKVVIVSPPPPQVARRAMPPPPPPKPAAKPKTPTPPPVAKRKSPPPPPVRAVQPKTPLASATDREIDGIVSNIGAGDQQSPASKPSANESLAPFFQELLAQREREPHKPFMFSPEEVELLVEGIRRGSTEHPESMPDIGRAAGTLVDRALPDDDAVKTLAVEGGSGWSFQNAQRISYAIDIMTQLSRDANFMKLPEVERVAISLKMGGLVDLAYQNGRIPDMDRITENAFASKKLSPHRPAMTLFAPGAMSASDAAPLSLALWTVMQDLKSMPEYTKDSATAMQIDALTTVITWRAGEGLNERSADRSTVLDVPSRDWVREKFAPKPVAISSTWDAEPVTQPRGRTVSTKAERVAEATAMPRPAVSDTFARSVVHAKHILNEMRFSMGEEAMRGREKAFSEIALDIALRLRSERKHGDAPASNANALARDLLIVRRVADVATASTALRKVDLNETVIIDQDVVEDVKRFHEHVYEQMRALPGNKELAPKELNTRTAVAALFWNQTSDSNNSTRVTARDGVDIDVPRDDWLRDNMTEVRRAPVAHAPKTSAPPTLPRPKPAAPLSTEADRVIAATRDADLPREMPGPVSLPRFSDPEATPIRIERSVSSVAPTRVDDAAITHIGDAAATNFGSLVAGGEKTIDVRRVAYAVEVMKSLRGHPAFEGLTSFTKCNLAMKIAWLIQGAEAAKAPVVMSDIITNAYSDIAPNALPPALSLAKPEPTSAQVTLVEQSITSLLSDLNRESDLVDQSFKVRRDTAVTSVMLWQSLPEAEQKKVHPRGKASMLPPIEWVRREILPKRGAAGPAVVVGDDVESPTQDFRRAVDSDARPTMVRDHDPDGERPTRIMDAPTIDPDPDGTRKTLIAQPAPKLAKSTPPPPRVGAGKAGDKVVDLARDTAGEARPAANAGSLEPLKLHDLTPTPSQALAPTVPGTRLPVAAAPKPGIFARMGSAMWRTITFIPRKIFNWIVGGDKGRKEVLAEAQRRDRNADEGMPIRPTKPSVPEQQQPQPQPQLTPAECDAIVKAFAKNGISEQEARHILQNETPFVNEVVGAWRGQAPELRGNFKGGFPEFFVAYTERAGRMAARGNTVPGGRMETREEAREREARTVREGFRPPVPGEVARSKGLPSLPETFREGKK